MCKILSLSTFFVFVLSAQLYIFQNQLSTSEAMVIHVQSDGNFDFEFSQAPEHLSRLYSTGASARRSYTHYGNLLIKGMGKRPETHCGTSFNRCMRQGGLKPNSRELCLGQYS